ncbi:hypothetical protein RB199_30425 [Streptomyces libani]|uniref:hypothetical protein n=1 Tax=Streptomyces nigrescens TaxID=1920 RepID=UPI00302D3E20
MGNKLRMTAATIAAAVALGVAAPMASATETSRATAATASVQAAPKAASLNTVSVADVQRAVKTGAVQVDAKSNTKATNGIGGAVLKAAKAIIAKYGKKAVQKIVKDWNTFRAWYHGLSNWNPIKWLFWVSGQEIISQVYQALRSIVF